MARRVAKKRGRWTFRLLLIAAVGVGAWWMACHDGDDSKKSEDATAGAPGVAPSLAKDPAPAEQEALRREMRRIARDEVAKALDDEPRGAPLPSRDERALAPHERVATDALPRPGTPPPTREEALSPAPEKGVAPPAPQTPAAANEEKIATPPPPSPTATDESLVVLDLSTAAAVDRKSREPVGVSSAFRMGETAAIWAHVVVRNDADAERRLTFIWKQDGVERTRADLSVGAKAARWRTWSKKNLLDGSVGHWAIEVVDESGLPLASRTFEVAP